MTIDDKSRDEKLQHGINREQQKKAKFTYSTFEKALEK